jgi:hypothetical protein
LKSRRSKKKRLSNSNYWKRLQNGNKEIGTLPSMGTLSMSFSLNM